MEAKRRRDAPTGPRLRLAGEGERALRPPAKRSGVEPVSDDRSFTVEFSEAAALFARLPHVE